VVHRRLRTLALAAAGAALLVPAGAQAQNYPEPRTPGKITAPPKGKRATHVVCVRKQRGCDFTRIQTAVNRARAGDRIMVRAGTYRESVSIRGARKSYLRIIGDPRNPRKVKLDGRRLGNRGQNAVIINGADAVTLDGLHAVNYKANGFFVTNAVDYTFRHLIAEKTGTYGIYAFNSKGGEMSDSEGLHVNDGAFYIGQTPPQTRPMRTIVRGVTGHSSVIGFTGTNMRYVTITKSRFYNNAIGITPNGLDSEKFPPPEDNVITDNDVFWNNLNFRKGNPPFPRRTTGTAALAPIGTGILLLGGRGHRIENNRIFGNYLVGLSEVEGLLIEKTPEARALRNNLVRNNAFGMNGEDRNGRDIAYDGNGTGNCFAGNTGVMVTLPADASTLAACPFSGANAFSSATQMEMLKWSVDPAETHWIKHPHKARTDGITPLEVFE
jgi:hypothetical protein